MSTPVFAESKLNLPDRRQGKVRESYTLSGHKRLLVTTDRLSAFDRVLGLVPYKGQVLNQLAAWWFARTADVIPNHVISVPDPNATVAVEAEPLPVEVVVRGYITGVTGTSLWYRYSLGERNIYGYQLPEGLTRNQRLPEPLITPTTKGGPTGHDERLTCAQVISQGYLDQSTWDMVQRAAMALYARGQEVAAQAGLVLVDTKYEFGRASDGRILLIDEVHTPDSSRFWKAGTEESLDKEVVRLAYAALGYRGDGEPPPAPEGLWDRASQVYREVYTRLTGEDFEPGSYPVEARLESNLKAAGWL